MKRETLSAAAPVSISAHQPAGVHVLADLSGIAADRLGDCAALEALLRAAAAAAGAHVLHSQFHGFGVGAGVTGVVLLAESHISIHTWPEHGFAAVDIFMCGGAQPELALAHIERGLQPGCSDTHTAQRRARAGRGPGCAGD